MQKCLGQRDRGDSKRSKSILKVVGGIKVKVEVMILSENRSELT